MTTQHRIQFDNLCPGNKAENVSKVHTNMGIKEFRITDEGLYTYKPSEKYLDYVAEQKNKEPKNFMIGTVEEEKNAIVNDNSKELKQQGNFTTSSGDHHWRILSIFCTRKSSKIVPSQSKTSTLQREYLESTW
jgi:hypothetical protein